MSEAVGHVAMLAVGAALLVPWSWFQSRLHAIFYRLPVHVTLHGWLGVLLLWASMILAPIGGYFILSHGQALLILSGVLRGPYFSAPDFWLGGSALTAAVVFAAWWLKRREFMKLVGEALLRCGNCSYPLQGLKTRERSIRCPECGHTNMVEDILERARRQGKLAELVQSGRDLSIDA